MRKHTTLSFVSFVVLAIVTPLQGQINGVQTTTPEIIPPGFYPWDVEVAFEPDGFFGANVLQEPFEVDTINFAENPDNNGRFGGDEVLPLDMENKDVQLTFSGAIQAPEKGDWYTLYLNLGEGAGGYVSFGDSNDVHSWLPWGVRPLGVPEASGELFTYFFLGGTSEFEVLIQDLADNDLNIEMALALGKHKEWNDEFYLLGTQPEHECITPGWPTLVAANVSTTTLASVPEPSSFTLMVPALLGLTLRRRRAA